LSKLPKNKPGKPSATLWLLDGTLVGEDDMGFFAKQLGASEARRYSAFKRHERRRQFLLGRMLLRFAVSRLLFLPPDTLGVVERDGNAPRLVLPDSQNSQAGFSLSHSRNWVACLLSSSGTLGVDIEVNNATRNFTPLSDLAFQPEEHSWMLSQPEASRQSAFYQLWCTREALYKLMSNSGRDRIIAPLVGADGALAVQGPGWHSYILPHSALTVAVCSERPLSALNKIELPRLTSADWLAAKRVSINSRKMANSAVGRFPA
jgi:4'-phosphopantetheinyl transferase